MVNKREARIIMGSNFIAPGEISKVIGRRLGLDEKEKLGNVPFTKERLQTCSKDFLLFPGVSSDKNGTPLTVSNIIMSLLKGSEYARRLEYAKMIRNNLLVKPWGLYFLAHATPQIQWYLVRKSCLLKSLKKTYLQQQQLLAPHEHRAKLVVYIYGALLALKLRNEDIFYALEEGSHKVAGIRTCNVVHEGGHVSSHVGVLQTLLENGRIEEHSWLVFEIADDNDLSYGLAPAIKLWS